jgi:hypothetical protein
MKAEDEAAQLGVLALPPVLALLVVHAHSLQGFRVRDSSADNGCSPKGSARMLPGVAVGVRSRLKFCLR